MCRLMRIVQNLIFTKSFFFLNVLNGYILLCYKTAVSIPPQISFEKLEIIFLSKFIQKIINRTG